MGLWNWIKSRLNRPTRDVPPTGPSPAPPPSTAPDRVRFFDMDCRRVVHIPPSELSPGCIQARVEGIEGVVWLLPDKLEQGPIRHPPFDEETRAYIRDIQIAFAEHRDLTFDEWEDGFRRDMNAVREIAYFSYAADLYRRFTKDETDPIRRADVYRLLVTCMTASREAIWHVTKFHALTRPEAERIVNRFYGGEKAGDASAT